MLDPLSVSGQCQRAHRDPLRVLVVGAGIAGVTVAGLLRRQGCHPVMVDRRSPEADAGYMLALMPMADPVFAELGVQERYRSVSAPVERFGILSSRGVPLRTDSLTEVIGRWGDYRGISRGALLDTLSSGGLDTAFATVVSSMHPADGPDGPVDVTFSTPEGEVSATFDLVVVADGLNSRTRDLVPGVTTERTDTGWSGWVLWLDAVDDARPESDEHPSLATEMWGAGFFIGAYPVDGAVGVFVGGPQEVTAAGPQVVAEQIRAQLRTVTPRTARILDRLVDARDPFHWPMVDARSTPWAGGRTVLLGDAAAGFLPTAGIGAGMAMESAWMLAAALRETAAAEVPERLALYERFQRPRVELAQRTSRQLARLMFRHRPWVVRARDLLLRGTRVEWALRPILRLVEHPADPADVTGSSGHPEAAGRPDPDAR